jgi:hypothetical protein
MDCMFTKLRVIDPLFRVVQDLHVHRYNRMILGASFAVRCLCRRSPPSALFRSFSSTRLPLRPNKQSRDELNYNPEIYFDDAPNPEHVNYKCVTSNDLESYREPPRRVKMLVRDYIEDSLYNPHYGYFSKQATIVTSSGNIDFASVRDSAEFQEEVAKRYAAYGRDDVGPGKQMWHTPTEIFKVLCFAPCFLFFFGGVLY